MKAELLPCPFCGSDLNLNIDNFRQEGHWWHYVECVRCQATGPVKHLKRDAIGAWNRRNNDECEHRG